MIELRWLKRQIPGQPDTVTEYALQYRTQALEILGMLAGKWSDWQDVPIVAQEGKHE